MNGNATDPLVISVPIGGKTTVSFEANVPEKMPMDVMILADTTGSSSGNLEVVKSQLLGLLRSTANNGNRVGLGAVSDVSTFPFGTVNDRPFAIIQPITELREVWEDKITRLQTVEGGGDGQEGQLPAVIASLAEKSGFTPDPGSRKVILLTTDGPPHVSTDQWCGDPCVAYPGPQTADVQALLDAKGITVIVLSRGHSGVLRSMAKRTGGAVIALDTISALPVSDPIADAYEATLVWPATGSVATPPGAIGSDMPLSAGPPIVQNGVEPIVAPTVVESTQTPGPADNGVDALTTVPSRVDQRPIKLQAALANVPVIVRPVVGACAGVSMVFDPPYLRVPVGGKATFKVTVEASPELLPSSQKCAVNLGFGSETVFSVDAKPLCEGPSSSSSSSSSVEPTSSTSTLVSTTSSSTVEPSTTGATPTTTITPTESSTTSSAPALTTTTIASAGPATENVTTTTTTSIGLTTPGTGLQLSSGPTIVASPTQSPEDPTGTSTSAVPTTTTPTSTSTVDQASSSVAAPPETTMAPAVTIQPNSSLSTSTTTLSAVTTTLPSSVVNPSGCIPRPPS